MTMLRTSLILAALMSAIGCSGRIPLVSADTSSLRVESLGEQRVAVSGRFATSIYSDAAGVETTFILSDAPVQQIVGGESGGGQMVHVELLWLPRPGWTPMSAEATNASIRYLVVSGSEVGVYAGAGFARPSGGIGSGKVTVSIKDASLRLVEQTDGFVDLLTPARISGSFTAEHDPRGTRRAHYLMSQLVTDAMGRSLFVKAEASRR